jgi:hypothetical protein
MSWLKHIWSQTNWGQLTTALFMICCVSGIFIAIPFDVEKPYESLSQILIANPAASFFRNLHYWSAQLFLVFSLIHIYDHFKKKEGIRLKKGIWFRLAVGVLIIFLAMLTGFLLKADADSLQARRILESLISGIPFIGDLLSYSLLGKEESFQLIYVHHIATFTIFLAIIIFEHVRKIWPKWGELLASTAVVAVLSFFITAPLHDNLNPTVKGPWYFLGLQEILHWLSTPSFSLLVVFLFVLLIYLVPFGNERNVFVTKRSLLILTALYLFLTIIGIFFRGPNWQWIWPTEKSYNYKALPQMRITPLNLSPELSQSKVTSSPLISGHKESCMACHGNMTGFTDAHNPRAIGCYSCHGGHPFESDKDQAHRGMLLVPGNLADADRSCGTANCHPQITSRINTGLMATLSGMISVDRFVFHEQDNPDLLTTVHQLGNSAADEHLRNLCVKCHLGNPKTEPGPVNETSRGGGCIACHVNYGLDAFVGNAIHTENPDDTTYLSFHPSIDMNVSNDHCFGCHSRSGRISTNYEGWHETTIEVDMNKEYPGHRIVEGTRAFTFVKADVHHELGLECIDCHNSYELMGDGQFYAHQEEQVTIRCEDCHFEGAPNLMVQKDLDQESAIIASMRFGSITGRNFLTTADRNRPLVNTYYKNDTTFFLTKNYRELHLLSPPAEICTRGAAHDDLSCSSCHTSWAPSCIGCHNEYDPVEPGYDMYTNTQRRGSWVEYIGEFNAHLPALGYRENEKGKEVIPVIPGMIMTIDVASFDRDLHDSLIFQRLFAPAVPHTTQTEGRDCKSCHNDPVALGYGSGKLEYLVEGENGRWTFRPKYQNNQNDGLPEDAWTGFLEERTGHVSTRSDVRPFSIREQQRILTVGACLTCHADESAEMRESLLDFDKLLEARSSECILPSWSK